jgi:hypothetical protein
MTRCPRCHGLVIDEWIDAEHSEWKCVNCGHRVQVYTQTRIERKGGMGLRGQPFSWLIGLWLVCSASVAMAQLVPGNFVDIRQAGVFQGKVKVIDCVSGLTCTVSGIVASITGSGGSFAPVDATYWVGAANGTLTNEINLGALGTGLVINTAGTPSILAGNTCAANNFGISLSASGVLGCAQPLFSNISGSVTDAQVPNNITIDLATLATTASALAANGGNCVGNNFALGVDASGVGECAQPAFSNLSGSLALSQTSMNTARLLGRTTAGTGVTEEISVGAPLTFSALTLDFDETATLGNNARVMVRKNTGADVGARRRLNLIEGTNVTLTVADDAGSEEVDVTIAATGGGGGYATIEDEAVPRTQRTTVNFTGAGVSCVDDGSSKTVCTISGGGAGSANVVEVSLSLGTGMGLYYATTVTGQAWVSASSVIACSMFGTTADGQTPETIAVAGIVPSVSDRVAGTGFNLNVYNPNGATGTVRAHCTGA